jgi:hypothetical protein
MSLPFMLFIPYVFTYTAWEIAMTKSHPKKHFENSKTVEVLI